MEETEIGCGLCLSQAGFFRRHFVFITSTRRRGFAVELEPSPLAPPDFTVAASSPPAPPPPQHHARLCEAVFPDFPHPPSGPLQPLFHLCPLPSLAAILHFRVRGLRETACGDSQYRMLIRPSAALPTIFLPDMSFCFVIDSIIIRRFP